MKKAIILLSLFTIILFLGCNGIREDIPEELFCNSDEECVPSTSCHPTSCINENYKEKVARGMPCTTDCRPDTLDCGQGSCICQENECIAQYN